jgi:hypothetical protein
MEKSHDAKRAFIGAVSRAEEVMIFANAAAAAASIRLCNGRSIWIDDFGCISFGQPDYPGKWRPIDRADLYRLAEDVRTGT